MQVLLLKKRLIHFVQIEYWLSKLSNKLLIKVPARNGGEKKFQKR